MNSEEEQEQPCYSGPQYLVNPYTVSGEQMAVELMKKEPLDEQGTNG